MAEISKMSGFLAMCLLVTLIVAPLSVYTYWDHFTGYATYSKNITVHSGKIFFSRLDTLFSEQNPPSSDHVIKKRSVRKNKTEIHKEACGKASKTCEDCVSLSTFQCLWCKKGKKCLPYPIKTFVPTSADCEWEDARWGVCWLDFRAMIIAVSVIGGIILLVACCCIVKCCRCVTDCCHVAKDCCCCSCFEEGRERRKELHQLKRLERKLESQARRQELMLKYGRQRPPGVAFGSTGNYTTFDNEPAA